MHQTLKISLLLAAVLAAACAAAKPAPRAAETPPEAAPAPSPAESMLEREARRLLVEQEQRMVMFHLRLEHARKLLRAGAYGAAEKAAKDALLFNPSSKDAFELLTQIQRALGVRAGTAADLLTTVSQEERARHEEHVAALRAALRRARKAMQADDWDAAEEHFQRAVYLAQSIERRWSDDGIKALSDEAARSLDRLQKQKR
ncbi:MAG: hypothetical protein O7C98_03240 [Planctomycetota bacterium]|nr:hypothetical protein [Planctomycetota bacterium]